MVFDFYSKMKVVKNCLWPYHCVEEEETSTLVKTTQNSDVGHGRTRRQDGCPCVQTRPTRATRLLRPNGLTRLEYQLTRPMQMTQILMTSAWHNCDVNMHSWHAMSATNHITRHHSGTHLPHHQPRAELSWSRATSRWIGFSVADPTCNQIWDWI